MRWIFSNSMLPNFGFGDPRTVCFVSTELLLNRLYDYFCINLRESDEVSGISAINDLILGLLWAYYASSHMTSWNVIIYQMDPCVHQKIQVKEITIFLSSGK